jgi:hypothetical protein
MMIIDDGVGRMWKEAAKADGSVSIFVKRN